MIVFDGKNRSTDVIDMRDTMYPTYAVMTRTMHCIDASEIGWATMFGFSFGNSSLLIGKKSIFFPITYFLKHMKKFYSYLTAHT